MARTSATLRAAAIVALSAGLIACSAAPASSPTGAATDLSSPGVTTAPTAAATPARTDSPSPTPDETVAPSEAAEPSEPAKPRPSIDQATIDAMLTSSLTLLNLADADLLVVVLYREAADETPFPLGSYTLAFTDQQTYEVPAGLYDLEFRQPADSRTGSTCTIELGSTDAYSFAAIDGAVAIARAGDPPTEASELFVATSSLCGK